MPSPDDDLNNAVLSQMEVPAQNQALISRLLESLETLKTKSSHHSSGGTSPSPLTNSAERAPSSPTEVIDFRYNFRCAP